MLGAGCSAVSFCGRMLTVPRTCGAGSPGISGALLCWLSVCVRLVVVELLGCGCGCCGCACGCGCTVDIVSCHLAGVSSLVSCLLPLAPWLFASCLLPLASWLLTFALCPFISCLFDLVLGDLSSSSSFRKPSSTPTPLNGDPGSHPGSQTHDLGLAMLQGG